MASCAMSKEAVRGMNVEMIRPDSSRKPDSAIARTSSIPRACQDLRGRRLPFQLADLHAAFHPSTSRRDAGCPGNGLVQVFAVQNVVPGKLLLGFGKGAVAGQQFAILGANGLGRARRTKRLCAFEDSFVASIAHH